MKVPTPFMTSELGRLDNRYVAVRLRFCHLTCLLIVFTEAQVLTRAQFMTIHSHFQ
jgi:hypothetical protein